jgi:hypothetical protein
MSITEIENAFVTSGAVTIGMSRIFGVAPGGTNPQYLVLAALDRNEYTASATGATGTFSGSGHVLRLGSIGGDGRGAGIVFNCQSTTGRYYSSVYGYFDELSFTSSASLNDITNLSLFGTSSLSTAASYASNVVTLMQVDAPGYLGSATIAMQPLYPGAVPAQATPQSIASIAQGFVGEAWNMEGCWVLASTIAAEAGASLPVQSTLIGLPGQSNGEWIVAFNGPAGQSGNWQSLVHAGEMIVIGTSGGGGHITTCVSGSGSTAMLVDNITYLDAGGNVLNSANDGSSSDVIVAAPHLASQEWSGVLASSVVIYELDTPVVTTSVTSGTVACLGSLSLGSLFSASDPAGRTVTQWQIYDTAEGNSLGVGTPPLAAHTAASALNLASLANLSLLAGGTTGTDTLEVRAYNGVYWGDWTAFNVSVTSGGGVPTPTPDPVLPPVAPLATTRTPGQTWTGGRAFMLTLPPSTFRDPQGQKLSYSARLTNGQALPPWLTYNAATDTFSGIAPTTAQMLDITVTATNWSGLSVSENFNATVIGAPIVTSRTSNQTWTEGRAVSFVLSSRTFTDPQGQALRYSAGLANGQALPSWLRFNAVTMTFSGTPPDMAQDLGIRVSATDTSGLSASEGFTVSVKAPATAPRPGITVTAQTPAQIWTAGTTNDLVLPSGAFTDALGLRMGFVGYQISGPDATSWLHFNAAANELSGTVPAGMSGTIGIAVIATDTMKMSAVDVFSIRIGTGSTPAVAPTAGTGQALQHYVSGLLLLHG